MARFTDKIAVVTGASKGIGAGIAKRLASEGATVVVNYASSREGAYLILDQIVSAGGKAVAIGGSVTSEDDMVRLFGEVQGTYGRIDVLVNNAGVFAFGPIGSVSVAEFHRHYDTNVLGLLLAAKGALPLFPPSGGSIVNIGSVVSTAAPPDASIYVGTKGAVDSITKSLAKEFAPRKVRVNGVNAGFRGHRGNRFRWLGRWGFRADRRRQHAARSCRPAAGHCRRGRLFASDDASWITGESLLVAGGSGM